MNNLDLLWSLQKSYNNIYDLKKDIQEITNDSQVKLLVNKLIQLEEEINKLEDHIQESKRSIKIKQSRISDDTYRLKEMEDNMYNGSVTDIKQLEFMDKETKNLKEEISNQELEIIELIDLLEDFEAEINTKKKAFEDSKVEYTLVVRRQNKDIKSKKRKIGNIEKDISELKKSVDKKFLDKYLEICKTKKGVGIVKVTNNSCDGRKIHLPTSVVEQLKQNMEVIQCENCSRILYYIPIEI